MGIVKVASMKGCSKCGADDVSRCRCPLADEHCHSCGARSHACPRCRSRVDGESYHDATRYHDNLCPSCKTALAASVDPVVENLLAAVETLRVYAKETLDDWDRDQDARVGKRLKAASGDLKGYDPRLDAVFDAVDQIRKATGKR